MNKYEKRLQAIADQALVVLREFKEHQYSEVVTHVRELLQVLRELTLEVFALRGLKGRARRMAFRRTCLKLDRSLKHLLAQAQLGAKVAAVVEKGECLYPD